LHEQDQIRIGTWVLHITDHVLIIKLLERLCICKCNYKEKSTGGQYG
jgi:hypothetical protein